jgi:hypothetical protein
MKSQHIQTVDKILHLEVGFTGELGAAGLTESIIEALTNGGVIEEAGIVYIKAETPGVELQAIDVWAPDPNQTTEPAEPPPEMPGGPFDSDEGRRQRLSIPQPEPNA